MTTFPPFQTTMNPLLEVLREAPDALAIEELDRRVLARMALPPEVLAAPHDPAKPDRSEMAYRIAWARSWLKNGGLIDDPARGRWRITDAGRNAGALDVNRFVTEIQRKHKQAAPTEGAGLDVEASPEDIVGETVEDEAAVPRVGPIVAKRLQDACGRLAMTGKVATKEQIRSMLDRFRERFGPDALASLDGIDLLRRMHGRGTRDSLVHWLEFKDDAEFASGRFGSIAGGSALKFGLYESVESGAWFTGSAHQQVRIETEQAIELARAQRQELLAMARVVRDATPDIEDEKLEELLVAAGPSLAQTAWGHKLLSVWFPETIDPFHVEEHRRHHLRCMLKLWGKGRYHGTSTFRSVSRQLGLSLVDLAAALVELNGEPYRTWRVGTRIDDSDIWPDMLSQRYAGVGWGALGSLADVPGTREGKLQIRSLLEVHYPKNAATLTKKAGEIFALAKTAQERDLIVAMQGETVLGVGRIVSDYEYLPGASAAHRRRVDWKLVGKWKLPETEALLTTFVELNKHPQNLLEIEARLLGSSGPPLPAPQPRVGAPDLSPPDLPPPPLDKFTQRVESILSRKGQVILYGPPGTGKTHLATIAARELAARAWFKRGDAGLTMEQRKEMEGARAVEWISFHPAYGYEDFLEGFRPKEDGSFERRDGVMKRLCARAAARPDRPFYLIVDEINRGDIPRIFGELLSVMEKDKRGRPITLPLSGELFTVPDNVFLLGTMNTADRSIALLDAALRRRFGFIELLPDATLLKGVLVGRVPLQAWLELLNARILEHAGRDARNLRIGHAYFLPGGLPVQEVRRFAEILREDVIPLLEETCYENFDALERILGSKIIQAKKRCVDESLFEAGRLDALQDAILQSMPDLATSAAATEAETAQPDPLEPDEAEEPDDAEEPEGT